MILRPLDPIPATSTDFLPAWSVVEQSQRQITNECWMITQPSHAALAGEFAARMTAVNLPQPGCSGHTRNRAARRRLGHA